MDGQIPIENINFFNFKTDLINLNLKLFLTSLWEQNWSIFKMFFVKFIWNKIENMENKYERLYFE